MVNKQSFIDAFGSLSNAAREIGCSRRSIYDWMETGEISEYCSRGLAAGKDWHKKIRDLGFNPANLKPL